MADGTGVEWARHPVTGRGATWNPIRARNLATGRLGWHCTHRTEGCRNCYAEAMNRWRGTGLPYKPGVEPEIEVFLDEAALTLPLRWREPRGIFVGSMTDLFGGFVSDEMIGRIFGAMALAAHHVFFVLTKRSDRMRAWFAARADREPVVEAVADFYTGDPELARRWPFDIERAIGVGTRGWPLPNVVPMVSCHDQPSADAVVPDLLATPAALRGVSYEPALGQVDFTRLNHERDRGWEEPMNSLEAYTLVRARKDWGEDCEQTADRPRLDWIIAGGESGPDARPMHPQWARDVRDQCAAAGVAFHFKQFGEFEYADRGHPRDGWRMLGQSGQFLPLMREDTETNVIVARRVGKARAGRLLDGVLHDAMPDMELRHAG